MNVVPAVHTAAILPFRMPGGTDGFTFMDRMALQGWSRRATAMGYGRVHIEPPRPGAGPDSAAFALIYRHNDPWSRYGLSRSAEGVTVWCSLTGHDLGAYPTMDAALATLK